MSAAASLVKTMAPVQRRLTLEALERFGPLSREAIPCAWPLTRDDLTAILAELVEAGAVTMEWDSEVPGRRVAALTDAGARLVRRLDDAAMDEAVAAATGQAARSSVNGRRPAARRGATRRPASPVPVPA